VRQRGNHGGAHSRARRRGSHPGRAQTRVEALQAAAGVRRVGIVLAVTSASEIYVRNKLKTPATPASGGTRPLAAEAPVGEVLAGSRIECSRDIDGILVQSPCGGWVTTPRPASSMRSIRPKTSTLHPANVGLLVQNGRAGACTLRVIELLNRSGIVIAAPAVVIGRSDIVGSRWRCCCCTATHRDDLHSRTQDLPAVARTRTSWSQPSADRRSSPGVREAGAVVIDVGSIRSLTKRRSLVVSPESPRLAAFAKHGTSWSATSTLPSQAFAAPSPRFRGRGSADDCDAARQYVRAAEAGSGLSEHAERRGDRRHRHRQERGVAELAACGAPVVDADPSCTRPCAGSPAARKFAPASASGHRPARR